MKEHWGQLEQGFRDTLVHKAERRAILDLGKLYGFERPMVEISEMAHRSALCEAAYARRGTKSSMFDVIENAMADYVVRFPSSVISTAYPNQIIFPNLGVIGTDADDIAARFTYRYIRTSYGLHLVERTEAAVSRLPVGATCDVLHLCAYDHPVYWSALPDGAAAQGKISLLPFVVRENIPGPIDDDLVEWTDGSPCVAEISLIDEVLSAVPPSYLLVDGDEGTPVGMPYGSQLLVDSNVDGNPSGVGPHPLYLYDGEGFTGLKAQLQRLMCLGTFLKMVHDP